MGVAIGIPVCGYPSWQLVRGLMSLEWPGGPRGFITAGEADRPLAIPEAHNRIIEAFLTDRRLDWLLMVDADATLHPRTLTRLLSWGQPIVGALCFSRYCPVAPTIYAGQPAGAPEGYYRIHYAETRAWIVAHTELLSNRDAVLQPRPDDALTPVDFTGAHCLLVRRDVLEAVGAPWFRRLTPESEAATGADRYFCERARAAGFPLYVDRSVVSGHMVGERCIGALDFLAWDAVTDWKARRFVVAPSASEPAALPGPYRRETLTIGEE